MVVVGPHGNQITLLSTIHIERHPLGKYMSKKNVALKVAAVVAVVVALFVFRTKAKKLISNLKVFKGKVEEV